MRNHTYEPNLNQYKLAILVKDSAFNEDEIAKQYFPLATDHNSIVVSLKYDSEKKVSAKTVKAHLTNLLAGLDAVNTKYIYCADVTYFKTLTKQKTGEVNIGYVFRCAIAGYEHMKVVLGINHKTVMFQPNLKSKLARSVSTMLGVIEGTYTEPGVGILQDYDTVFLNAGRPKTTYEFLHNHPKLTADIETTSLNFVAAKLLTIAFSWDDSSSRVFQLSTSPGYVVDKETKYSLKHFLEQYEGTLIWHNATYDLKVLIRQLWMKDLNDYEGMLKGLEVLTRNFEDTKIIAYLATNNAGGNHLSLKELAHPYAGNYAVDVKNASSLRIEDLAKYNAIDACSTFWVYNTYTPLMVDAQQEDIYRSLMLPSLKTIIAAEMTGMPMDKDSVKACEDHIKQVVQESKHIIDNHPIILKVVTKLRTEAMHKKNATLKTIQHPIEKFTAEFNPGSPIQLIELLYGTLELPVLFKTDTGKPKTSTKVFEALYHHTDDDSVKTLLEALVVNRKALKILTTFITAFHNAIDTNSGARWLYGNFNLGGTVSGRLSSSKPNLQNLPSGSKYGKMIKGCFKAPAGWLMVGADFNALEARVCALTTQDPEMMKIYSEGYDSHSFNANTYWPNAVPDLEDTPQSINTIKDLHPKLRDKSKTVTFALQYGGTPFALVRESGFEQKEADEIYKNYLEKFKVSKTYQQDKIDQATLDGYVTVAFGLRVRAPLLASTVLGNRITPNQAREEGRTIANALSQSYGLLTNRSANAVMERVWKSEYRNDIKLIAMIHDANYFIVKDDLATVEWLNLVLIEEMSWQELPEIRHEIVKLGAELEIYYPSWANPIGIPNGASQEEISNLCIKAMSENANDVARKKNAGCR